MLPQEKIHYKREEYIDLERSSEEKFDFRNGNILAMNGSSVPHNQVQINLILPPEREQ
jgi:Uma2 family endonuclease